MQPLLDTPRDRGQQHTGLPRGTPLGAFGAAIVPAGGIICLRNPRIFPHQGLRPYQGVRLAVKGR